MMRRLTPDQLREANGFTLVELIVVVMVIGILSSIAVPQFLSAADKAKQKEASTTVASLIKAASAYYTEYSDVPSNAGHIKEYASLQQCNSASAATCKTSTPTTVSHWVNSWNTPSGNYRIQIEKSGNMFRVQADPQGGAFATRGINYLLSSFVFI